jgi:hypothetical protein
LSVAAGSETTLENYALSSDRIVFPAAVHVHSSSENSPYGVATLAAGADRAELVPTVPGFASSIHVRESDGAVFYSFYSTQFANGNVFRVDFSDNGKPQSSSLGTYEYPHIRLSPDGRHVVVEGPYDIHSIPADGGAPTLLASGWIGDEYRGVGFHSFTPDSSHVLLLRPVATYAGNLELFSVPVGGGTPISLNEAKETGRGILTRGVTDPIQVSLDSRDVLYLATEETDSRELYMAPIEGGPRIRLNGDLIEGGNVLRFRISPDGSSVVYLADQREDKVYELFSVPIRLYWNRDRGGEWGTVGNWGNADGQSTGFLPERATTVFIDSLLEPVRLVRDEVNQGYVEVASLLIGTQTSEHSSANLEVDIRKFDVTREMEIGARGRLGISFGTLSVGEAIVNRGDLDVPFHGLAIISATNIHNAAGGSIVVADDSRLILRTSVLNEGDITLAPTAELTIGSTLQGHGTHGLGSVTIESLHPGLGIGEASFGGDLTLTSLTGSSLVVELGGSRRGVEYDAVRVAGRAEVGGGLDVQLAAIDGEPFAPQAGDVFEFLSGAAGVQSRFSHVLPPSPDWAIRYDDTSIRLEVLDPRGRGDYNGDGRIDQADLDLVLLQGWGAAPLNERPLLADWTDYLPMGAIDQGELDAVLLDWGREIRSASIPAGIAGPTIPEPRSLPLCIAACAAANLAWTLRSAATYNPPLACLAMAVLRRRCCRAPKARRWLEGSGRLRGWAG